MTSNRGSACSKRSGIRAQMSLFAPESISIRTVLYATSVRLRVGGRNGFTRHHFFESGFHIVCRRLYIGQISAPLVIDSPFVNENSIWIDYIHVRGGFCPV